MTETSSRECKKIFVLGSNSFSGQDFIDLLLDNPLNEVIGISRSVEQSRLFLSYRARPNLAKYRYYQIDLNNQMPKLFELLDRERPHYIVNFAAQSEVAPSWKHPEHWFQTNTVALAQLVNHLRYQDYLERYLHISSPEVYGNCEGTVKEDAPLNPSTPYAASKASADLLLSTYAEEYGFPLISVRATNVYGSRQQLFKIIPRSAIYMMNGTKIELHGGGLAIKSYIHIRDVSRGELDVLEKGDIQQLYHLSPDDGVAVRDVVKLISEKMGCSFEDVTTVVNERPGQDGAYIIDSNLARSSLGWSPQIDIEEGLSDVVKWVKDNWQEIEKQPLEYAHKE